MKPRDYTRLTQENLTTKARNTESTKEECIFSRLSCLRGQKSFVVSGFGQSRHKVRIMNHNNVERQNESSSIDTLCYCERKRSNLKLDLGFVI